MIVCPNCNEEFESDTELIHWVDDGFIVGIHITTEHYQCPVCSDTYNDIRAFYEGENE
jgi:hypothetical protein